MDSLQLQKTYMKLLENFKCCTLNQDELYLRVREDPVLLYVAKPQFFSACFRLLSFKLDITLITEGECCHSNPFNSWMGVFFWWSGSFSVKSPPSRPPPLPFFFCFFFFFGPRGKPFFFTPYLRERREAQPLLLGVPVGRPPAAPAFYPLMRGGWKLIDIGAGPPCGLFLCVGFFGGGVHRIAAPGRPPRAKLSPPPISR